MDAGRKKKLKERKQQRRVTARTALPLTGEQMEDLFVGVDTALAQSPCDHTLRLTYEHLKKAGVSAEPVVAWLLENGGCCDCEVVMNAENAWREAIQ